MAETGYNKITLIRDKLVSIVVSELPDYRRIPNPYSVEANSKLILFKAYGVGIGPGARIQLETGCGSAAYERTYNLVLAQQMNATPHDIERRAEIESSIIEDFVKANNVLEKNVTLDGIAFDSEYSDDSGIQLLETENDRFVSLNVNYIVRYTETI